MVDSIESIRKIDCWSLMYRSTSSAPEFQRARARRHFLFRFCYRPFPSLFGTRGGPKPPSSRSPIHRSTPIARNLEKQCARISVSTCGYYGSDAGISRRGWSVLDLCTNILPHFAVVDPQFRSLPSFHSQQRKDMPIMTASNRITTRESFFDTWKRWIPRIGAMMLQVSIHMLPYPVSLDSRAYRPQQQPPYNAPKLLGRKYRCEYYEPLLSAAGE